jgi:fructokinase
MEFLFGGISLEEGMDKLLSMGPSVVLCTRGELGSIYATTNFRGTKDIVKLESVDSVGCGDSYLSGILSVLCEFSLEEIIASPEILDRAVGYGAAAAALTSTERGVTGALPTADKVDALLETR